MMISFSLLNLSDLRLRVEIEVIIIGFLQYRSEGQD